MTFPTPIPAAGFLGTWDGITYYTCPNVGLLTRAYIPWPYPPTDPVLYQKGAIKWLSRRWSGHLPLPWPYAPALTPEEKASWRGYPMSACNRGRCKGKRPAFTAYHAYMSFNMHKYWDAIDADHWPPDYRTTPP
jgi:hypothetical protein